MQTLISFALASFAIRKLVGGESFFITGRTRERAAALQNIVSARLVVMILVSVKSRERFVKLRSIRIIFDPAFEKILAEREIFPLRLDTQGLARLVRSFSAATLAFHAMCHAAMSQNKMERGCSVVASRKSSSTRPHSVRSQATCAWMKATSATSERKPLSAAINATWPICSRRLRSSSCREIRSC